MAEVYEIAAAVAVGAVTVLALANVWRKWFSR
jgi:hypothetical protein